MTSEDIIQAVCDVTGVSRQALFGECRMRRVSNARFLCWLAFMESLGESCVCIARYFDRDPSTISHGLSSAQRRLDTDKRFHLDYAAVTRTLNERKAA